MDGMDSNMMKCIPSHSITFIPSDLDGMRKLLYSVIKYPNNGMTYLFYFVTLRSIPLDFVPFRSVQCNVSKHSLRERQKYLSRSIVSKSFLSFHNLNMGIILSSKDTPIIFSLQHCHQTP